MRALVLVAAADAELTRGLRLGTLVGAGRALAAAAARVLVLEVSGRAGGAGGGGGDGCRDGRAGEPTAAGAGNRAYSMADGKKRSTMQTRTTKRKNGKR